MDKAIIHLKVQFDGATQTLRLLVPAFEALLEPDEVYELNVPVHMHDETEVEGLLSTENPVIAHA
ncbi:MAG TPA: hypothetical protein VGK48_17990 [Terriglobia bacterium]|jgi:hypothetical protein